MPKLRALACTVSRTKIAMSGPKHPMVNSPAAIASTTNRIAAWWKMKVVPAFMSIQIAWMRLLDDSVGRAIPAARWITTDPIRLAETRKLSTSSA